MKTFKIHFIRHGITEANLKGQYVGNRTDLPLCYSSVDELRALRDTIDYPDEVFTYLQNSGSLALKRKTISKICDSFRFDESEKERFKSLR